MISFDVRAWLYKKYKCSDSSIRQGDLTMKKFLNRHENAVEEMLHGLAMLSPGVMRLPGHKVMFRADAGEVHDQQVAVISGGGSRQYQRL